MSSWIRKRPNSKFWYADFYDKDGKRVRKSLGTESKKEAEERLVDILYQRNISRNIIRKITFQDFKNIFLCDTRADKRYKTFKIYRDILKMFSNYLSENTVVCYLEDISREILNNYKHYRMNQVFRGRKLSPHTINIELRTLKALFNEAIKKNLIRTNPMKDVTQVECVEKPVKKLEIEAYKRIIREARILYPDPQKDSFVALLLGFVYSGARKEELLNLTPEQIDFEHNVICIHSHGDYRTKTGRMRFVKLHPSVVEELKQLRKFPDFVFYSETGRPYREHFYRKFKRLVEKLDLKWVTIHTLRHSLASHLAERGASFTVIAQILGHASINTTLKFYQHTTPRECAEAINLIPDFEKVNI